MHGFLKPDCRNLTATLREKALTEGIALAGFCDVLGTPPASSETSSARAGGKTPGKFRVLSLLCSL